MSQQHQNSVVGNFRTETHGNQTVHVRENSDTALEDLFSVVQNPNPHKQSDWTGRKLPHSFFHPPQHNQNVGSHNHSRNGSQDSTQFGQGIVLHHTRSRSAPVQSLPQSMSLPQQPQHAKQQSVDLIEDMQTMQLSQTGWNTTNSHNQADMQRYNFVGPNSQQSQQQQQQQWVSSPNKSHSATALNQGPSPGALSPNHSLSPAPSLQNVIAPLPPGWEMSVTPDGEIYYINHIDKTTSWFHPLMSNKNQPGPTKIDQLHPQHQVAITQHIQQQQQALAQQQQQQQSPQQQMQPQTATPSQQSQPSSQIASPAAGSGGGLIGGQRPPTANIMSSPSSGSSSSSTAVSEAYIRSELMKLQKQKETLRRQQEEIAKKEHLLTRNFGPNNSSSTPLTSPGNNSLGIIEENPPNSNQSNSSQESQLALMKEGSGVANQPANSAIQAVSTSGVDPFLGQAHNTADSHARQNSADSGLGGMGTSYSLPRTPEDFLSNVDEMDSTDGGHKIPKAQSSDFNMNDMEGLGMDVTGMSGDAHSTPMDEHELMPSLQDDISSELLEGMEGQKIDNLLTWL